MAGCVAVSEANKLPSEASGPTHSRFVGVAHKMQGILNPVIKKFAVLANLAGVAGFEPTHAGVKVPCLTAWLHPTDLLARVVGFEPTNVGVRVPCLTAWRYPIIEPNGWGE